MGFVLIIYLLLSDVLDFFYLFFIFAIFGFALLCFVAVYCLRRVPWVPNVASVFGCAFLIVHSVSSNVYLIANNMYT